jgi:hypothetical protein
MGFALKLPDRRQRCRINLGSGRDATRAEAAAPS